jgi:peptidoglycan/LPS O-acetylase OafA/YrhL
MTDPARLPLVDAVKAVGAQLIVLHHLAWYGPLGDTVAPLAPALFDWLTYHARLAVQAFLVVGGLLAAASLAPAGVARFDDPLARIGRRWRRLAPTYLCALALALAAGAFARSLIVPEAVPSPPTWGQVLANAAMLYVGLRRRGLYRPSPGWPAFFAKVAIALVVLALLLWLGNRQVDWTAMQGEWPLRAALLAGLIGGGAAAYVVVLLLLGFRPRDFAVRGQ